MIQRLSHTTVWVTDLDVAFDFYVNKLGLTVNTDMKMDNGFRWLTLSAPAAPDFEIIMMPIEAGMALNEEQAAALRGLVTSGALGAGVFNVDDCHKTYDELVAKGVKFKGEPVEQFYGIEAVMMDPFGNWFSVCQPK